MPDGVISKAKTYLKELETESSRPDLAPVQEEAQISLIDAGTDEVARILRRTDIDSLTPLEALNLLSELRKKVNG